MSIRTRLSVAAALAAWLAVLPSAAEVSVTAVDLAELAGFEINAAGPVLVKTDAARNRVVGANALSSSLTVYDGKTGAVKNIAVGHRTLQHLQGEALAIRALTGEIYLICDHALVVVEPGGGAVAALPTEVQFESVAVDDVTGNAFLVGRESTDIAVYEPRRGKLRLVPWLDHSEDLVNLNQTPPPPSRRVVALSSGKPDVAGRIVAVDGHGAMLYLFDAKTIKLLSSREIGLAPGGRWHLAGVNPVTRKLYLVTETNQRAVVQAAKVDLDGYADVIVPLPGMAEGVGMAYHPLRDQVYVNYDNHATMHVVDFGAGGALKEVALPSYGNDAVALDLRGDRLFVASWAHGEVEVVDLATLRFTHRYTGLGILPHMHAMTWNATTGTLLFPVGATAVNGCYGAALTELDPASGESRRIRTGWAPITLAPAPAQGGVLVFANDDQFAVVTAAGEATLHDLPRRFPTRATTGPDGRVHLIYGPHQSFWPTVYIWGARNGVLSIDPETLATYDRRLPRQTLDLAWTPEGVLWLAQNNWGKEAPFLVQLADGVREVDVDARLELDDSVIRETTQRVLRYDEGTGMLYLLRVGERDGEPGHLLVADPATGETVRRRHLGEVPTDLLFDDQRIYTADFGSDTVSVIDKTTWKVSMVDVGAGPLRLARIGERVFVMHHLEPVIAEVGGAGARFELPFDGTLDQLVAWGDRLVVAGHTADQLQVIAVDPATGAVETLVHTSYGYGDVGLDSANSAYYMTGQFGDAVFTLTPAVVDPDGRLWLADFLSGTVYVIARTGEGS